MSVTPGEEPASLFHRFVHSGQTATERRAALDTD